MIPDNSLTPSLCLETKDSATNVKTISEITMTTTPLTHPTETETMKTTTTFTIQVPTSTSVTMQPGINAVRHAIAFH